MGKMTCKFIILSIVWSVIDLTTAGLIDLESDDAKHYDHHHHVANSYMHFHGPVEGPAFEVKVPYIIPHHHDEHAEHNHLHDHHGYVLDYTAHPKYEYKYGVEDYHTGDFHSQKETRDGHAVHGEYTILEPGGRFRTVKYTADKDGFHAEVHHTGKNEHHGGTYGGHEHQGHIMLGKSHELNGNGF